MEQSQTRITDLLVHEVEDVVITTLRYPNVVREGLYLTRVQPLFGKMTTDEILALPHECGYAHGIGWAVLSQALGIMSGQDRSRKMGMASPTPLYTPKHNYGGWVRIFRSKAAALPLSSLDFVTDSEWRRLLPGDPASEARARGVWGINPIEGLTWEVLRDAIAASDLFTAPWMAAIWRPDHGWAVQGVATRYLAGDYGFQHRHEDVVELFSRPYADQVRPSAYDASVGAYTFLDAEGRSRFLSRPGPDLGIREVVKAIEMGLRLGYRIDLLAAPVKAPLETWEDVLVSYSETPLMGVLLQLPTLSLLPSFQAVAATKEIRIEGIDPRDYEAFHAATGVDPRHPLTPEQIEDLAILGIPVFGRFPSFFAYRQGEEPKV